jgi:hypothetical protein
MNSSTPVTFPGMESWNGTATVAYSGEGMSWAYGGEGLFQFTISKSSGGTIVLYGEVVINDISSTFNKTEVPTATLTFDGNGDLTEAP